MMIKTINTYNSFWLIIFCSIVIIAVTSIIGVVIVKLKGKDNNLFGNIFNRHVDEHIDTTDKFSKAHSEVVDGLPTQYQHELHSIEETVKQEKTRLDKLVNDVSEINEKLNILLEWKFETERKK